MANFSQHSCNFAAELACATPSNVKIPICWYLNTGMQTNLGCPGVPYTPELYFVNALGHDPQAAAAANIAAGISTSGHDADGGVGALALLRLEREFDRSIQWAAVEASEFDEKGVTLQQAAASLVLTDSGVSIDWCWSRNGTFSNTGAHTATPKPSNLGTHSHSM